MAEDAIIRQELDQFTTELLTRGLSKGWIGLELMTLGMGMLTATMGTRKMAHHFRTIAEQFEKSTERGGSDTGYSAIG
jgi:hypothetical protein